MARTPFIRNMETPISFTPPALPPRPERPSHPEPQRALQILPRRLDFEMDDRTIISPSIPSRYLMRQIGLGWYHIIESLYPNVEPNTRILVRRDRYQPPSVSFPLIHDYLTVRVNHPTLHNGWVHVSVAYPASENSPYPFDVDGYHDREGLFRRMPQASQASEPSSNLLFALEN
jgi:hypothetical protein